MENKNTKEYLICWCYNMIHTNPFSLQLSQTIQLTVGSDDIHRVREIDNPQCLQYVTSQLSFLPCAISLYHLR